MQAPAQLFYYSPCLVWRFFEGRGRWNLFWLRIPRYFGIILTTKLNARWTMWHFYKKEWLGTLEMSLYHNLLHSAQILLSTSWEAAWSKKKKLSSHLLPSTCLIWENLSSCYWSQGGFYLMEFLNTPKPFRLRLYQNKMNISPIPSWIHCR